MILIDKEGMYDMKTTIYEYLIYPIMAASGGNLSGPEIICRVALFLFALLAVMYGLPMCLVALT